MSVVGRDACPRCGYKGPRFAMFEVPSHRDAMGRIIHVATLRDAEASNAESVHTLCGRAIHRGHIYGGEVYGIHAYDPARPGLCKQCQRRADQ